MVAKSHVAGWELAVGRWESTVTPAADPTIAAAAQSISRVTDEELVLLARQGDPDAFDQLVGRHQSAVFRAALAALRVREDAEEVAQDTFVRAWRALDRFRGDSSFRTWILRIAWNRAISKRRGLAGWLRRATPIAEVAEPAATGDGQHAWMQNAQLQAHAASAIQALSPKLRDAMLLAQSGEYQYDEIARMLGVPLGTVKWRISEARRKVRETLAALGYVDAK
jgi:RNA polymerase sigma-70 factor (ECF subfamily)